MSITINIAQGKDLLETSYNFKNISINYLDWSAGTIDRLENSKNDFGYLEFETGAGFDWGEAYFFADIENPFKGYSNNPPENRRFASKQVIDINIGESNFSYHVQNYYFKEKDFYVNNFVAGFSYKYKLNTFWIRPFLGAHYQIQSYYTGMNGGMMGWVFGYDFKLLKEDLSISQWHEHEFNRDKETYLNNDGTINPYGDGDSSGINGSIALSWYMNKNITFSYQYRYADNKLGGGGVYQNANVFSIKYLL